MYEFLKVVLIISASLLYMSCFDSSTSVPVLGSESSNSIIVESSIQQMSSELVSSSTKEEDSVVMSSNDGSETQSSSSLISEVQSSSSEGSQNSSEESGSSSNGSSDYGTLSSIENMSSAVIELTYPIVSTGTVLFYDNFSEVSKQSIGDAFYGQDAHFPSIDPSYSDNGDGTIDDNVTGLMWQQAFEVMTFSEAVATLESLSLGGHSDWRLPTIKELYSLMLFSGKDVSGPDDTNVPAGAIPFIDTAFFDFEYGANGTRIIDTQILSSTKYKGLTMMGDSTVFGLNVADGRIKGYPLAMFNSEKDFTVRFVRGSTDYGVNVFVDNTDGTISDNATGLMWEQGDSEMGKNWEDALAWAQSKNSSSHLGYSDWRLPNAKELHSIVDYSRSKQEQGVAAIDPLFETSEITVEDGSTNFPFYWSSTTHANMMASANAVYISFGEALGFFSGLKDVHGAGAQRSDPKTGDASDYPNGHGPQGDVIRILNYVRLVRTVQ